MIRGSTPTTEEVTIFAKGLRLYCSTASPEATITVAAPSFNPEAFPAVTDPSFLKAGRNLANDSKVEFGRINSSSEKIIGSFLRCGISTEVISS